MTEFTYKVVFDQAYCSSLRDRYLRQLPIFLRPNLIIPLQSAITGILLFLAVANGLLSWGAFSRFLGFVVAISFVEWCALIILPHRRVKKKIGLEVAYMLNASGITIRCSNVAGELNWSFFSHAARFADGILLVNEAAVYWLPDFALFGSDVGGVTNLVRSKVRCRHIV